MSELSKHPAPPPVANDEVDDDASRNNDDASKPDVDPDARAILETPPVIKSRAHLPFDPAGDMKEIAQHAMPSRVDADADGRGTMSEADVQASLTDSVVRESAEKPTDKEALAGVDDIENETSNSDNKPSAKAPSNDVEVSRAEGLYEGERLVSPENGLESSGIHDRKVEGLTEEFKISDVLENKLLPVEPTEFSATATDDSTELPSVISVEAPLGVSEKHDTAIAAVNDVTDTRPEPDSLTSVDARGDEILMKSDQSTSVGTEQANIELKETWDAGVSQDTEKIDSTSEKPKESAGAESPRDAKKVVQASDNPNETLDANARQATSQLFNHGEDSHGENRVEPQTESLEETTNTTPKSAAHTFDASERLTDEPVSTKVTDAPNDTKAEGHEKPVSDNGVSPASLHVPTLFVPSPSEDTKPRTELTNTANQDMLPEGYDETKQSLDADVKKPVISPGVAKGTNPSDPSFAYTINTSATTDDDDTTQDRIKTSEMTSSNDRTGSLNMQKEEHLLGLHDDKSAVEPIVDHVKTTEKTDSDTVKLPHAAVLHEEIVTQDAAQLIQSVTLPVKEDKSSSLTKEGEEPLSHTVPDPLGPVPPLQKDDVSNVDLVPPASDDVGQLYGAQSPNESSSQLEHLVVKNSPKPSFLLDAQIHHPLGRIVDLPVDSISQDSTHERPAAYAQTVTSKPPIDQQDHEPEITKVGSTIVPPSSTVDVQTSILPPIMVKEPALEPMKPPPSDDPIFSQQAEDFIVEQKSTVSPATIRDPEGSFKGLGLLVLTRDIKASDSVPPGELSSSTTHLQTHEDQSSLPVHGSKAAPKDHPDVDEVENLNINTELLSTVEQTQGRPVPEGALPEPAPSGATSQASMLPHTDLDASLVKGEVASMSNEDVEEQNQILSKYTSQHTVMVTSLEDSSDNQVKDTDLTERIDKAATGHRLASDGIPGASENPAPSTTGIAGQGLTSDPGHLTDLADPNDYESTQHDEDKVILPAEGDTRGTPEENLATGSVKDLPSNQASLSGTAESIQPINNQVVSSVIGSEAPAPQTTELSNTTFAPQTLTSQMSDEAAALALSSAQISTDTQETSKQFTSRPAPVIDEEAPVNTVGQPDKSFADSDLNGLDEQPGEDPVSQADDTLGTPEINADGSSRGRGFSGTQSFNETTNITWSHPCDVVDGMGNLPQNMQSVGNIDLLNGEEPKDVREVTTLRISSVLHADPEVLDPEPSTEPSLLRRVHARAFSGDSIEGFPLLSPTEAPYPVYVEPPSAQQVSASFSEGQSTGMPEYQFAPLKTSANPDVVILHDIQDDSSDAPSPGVGMDGTRMSVQANDVLLATPQVEPRQSTIGSTPVTSPVLVAAGGDASIMQDHNKTMQTPEARSQVPRAAGLTRHDVYAERTQEPDPISTTKDISPTVDTGGHEFKKASELVTSFSQEEIKSVTQVSQLERSSKGNQESDGESSLLHSERSLHLEQSEEGRPSLPVDQTLDITIESNDMPDTEDQTISVETPVRKLDAIATLPGVNPTPPSPKVTSVTPGQSIPETRVTPEDAEATADAERQAISESQASACPEAASETLAKSPKQPEPRVEDSENDASAAPDITKVPLIARILAEKEKDAPETPVETDDESSTRRGNTVPDTLIDITDDQDGKKDTSSTSGIVKGPLIARIITENGQERPSADIDGNSESAELDGDTTPLTTMNVTSAPLDAETSRSDIPEVATTPRSELGVFTPTFDSRSEVSVASNEPIPSLSPRTDPASPVATDFEVPVLALGGVLVLSTDLESAAESAIDIASEATSEASIEPVPPSSPVQDITPTSAPTRQDSTSQSPKLAPLAPPSNSISTDTIPSAAAVPTKDIPTSGLQVTLSEVPVDTASMIQGLETTIEDTRRKVPPISEDSTPREPESDLLSNDAEQSDEPNGAESKTPSPPSWAISPPPPPQAERPERGEHVSSPSRASEQFPSVERFPVQIVPLPDDDESSSKPSENLDIPSTKTRTRLVSAASSRLLPGGWKTDSPRPQGLASLEMAQGEFSPPIRPQEVESTESKKSGTKCLLM